MSRYVLTTLKVRYIALFDETAERVSSGMPEIFSVSNMLYRSIEVYYLMGFKAYTSDKANMLVVAAAKCVLSFAVYSEYLGTWHGVSMDMTGSVD